MMYLKWVQPAIFGVISLWFVMTTSEPDSNHHVIQPVGPRMCHHLCSHRIGCSAYHYTPLHLSCRLIIGKISSDQQSLEGIYYHKISKIYQAKRNMSCLRNSKIFYTRRNIRKCRRLQLQPSRQMEFTRLLMLPFSKKSHQGRQLYLRNKTVSPYPYVSVKTTTAVAYISSMRKLVICASNKLFLTTLDGTDRTMITHLTHVTGITVDDEQQLVFLTSVLSNTLHAMTTEGKGLSLITTVPGKPGQVAADSQRQVIYVAVGRQHIARYTYNGQLERAIVRGFIHSPLYLNSKRNVLYYMGGRKKWTLFKMFLSNGTKLTIPLPLVAVNVYVYSSTLYCLLFSPKPTSQGKLYSVKPSTSEGKLYVLSDRGKYIETIKTGFDTDVPYIVFCAIP